MKYLLLGPISLLLAAFAPAPDGATADPACRIDDYGCQIVTFESSSEIFVDLDRPLSSDEVMGETFGPFGERIVASMFVGGHRRVFASMAGDIIIAVDYVDYSSPGFVRGRTRNHAPAADAILNVVPRARRILPAVPSPKWQSAGTELPIDHLIIEIAVLARSADDESAGTTQRRADELLLDVVTRQVPLLVTEPDRNDTVLRSNDLAGDQIWLYTRIAFNVACVVAVAPLLLDRGRRQLLTGLGKRRQGIRPISHVSVTNAAGRLRRRAIAVGLAGFGGLVAGMWVGFAAMSLAWTLPGAMIGWIAATTVSRRGLLGRRVGPASFATSRGAFALPRMIGTRSLGAGIFALLLAALGFSALNLGLTILWAGYAPANGEFSAAELSRFSTVAIVFSLIAFAAVRLPIRRLEARYRAQIATQVDQDVRRPVVMLRSFADDGRRIWTRRSVRHNLLDRLTLRRRDLFEELLAWRLWRMGPVVAIGQPGRASRAPLGAARGYYEDEDWQQVAERMIADACSLLIVVGQGEGLRWEIEMAGQVRLLNRTMFVLPPTSDRDRASRLEALSSILPEQFIPEVSHDERTLAIVTNRWGEPTVVTSRSVDDASYDAALDIALDLWSSTIDEVPGADVGVFDQALPAGQIEPPKRTGRWVAAVIGAYVLVQLWSAAVEDLEEPTQEAYPVLPASAVALGPGPSILGSNYQGLWLTDIDDQSLRGVDDGREVERLDDVTTGTRNDLAVSGNRAVVADTAASEYVIVDLVTGTLTDRRPLPGPPAQIASHSDQFAITLPTVGAIALIDLSVGPEARIVQVGGAPWAIGGVEHGTWIFGDAGGSLRTLDAPTGNTTEALSAEGHFRSIATGEGVWIAGDYVGNRIAVVSESAVWHDLPGQPVAVALQDGDAFVVTVNHLLVRIDLSSGFQTVYRIGGFPEDVLVFDDELWITQPANQRVLRANLPDLNPAG